MAIVTAVFYTFVAMHAYKNLSDVYLVTRNEIRKRSGHACEIIVQNSFIRVATLAVLACLASYMCNCKTVAKGSIGQILAKPLFLKVKIKFHSKKATNKQKY